jgi:hypothetical protein
VRRHAAQPWAQAGYFTWDMVELPASSGASCGNGTPYRFFVNRTPLNHDVAITFEGGGACWDQNACEGKGEYAASNPDGIPPDYMKSLKYMAARGLVTRSPRAWTRCRRSAPRTGAWSTCPTAPGMCMPAKPWSSMPMRTRRTRASSTTRVR